MASLNLFALTEKQDIHLCLQIFIGIKAINGSDHALPPPRPPTLPPTHHMPQPLPETELKNDDEKLPGEEYRLQAQQLMTVLGATPAEGEEQPGKSPLAFLCHPSRLTAAGALRPRAPQAEEEEEVALAGQGYLSSQADTAQVPGASLGPLAGIPGPLPHPPPSPSSGGAWQKVEGWSKGLWVEHGLGPTGFSPTVPFFVLGEHFWGEPFLEIVKLAYLRPHSALHC